MTAHFLLINEMITTYQDPRTHELMKLYPYKLKGCVFEDLANGRPIEEYTDRRNIVSDITTGRPEDAHARMTRRTNIMPQASMICTDWQSFMQITRPSTRFRTEMDEPDG